MQKYCDRDDHLYRPGVGMMIVNQEGLIFAGKRIDFDDMYWQMPQGGIDEGEDLLAAMWRELFEETGIKKKNISEVIKEDTCFYYDFPKNLSHNVWNGRYKGQKHVWFLLRYQGDGSDISITREPVEFKEWMWVKPADLLACVVPFKYELYKDVFQKLGKYV